MTGPAHYGLRVLLASAAAEAGFSIDVEHVVRQLAASARAFERRRATPNPVPAAVRRRRLRRLAAAANALEDALAALGRDGRASLDAWDSPAATEAWRAALERLATRAEALRDRPGQRGRPGPRPDEATRSLVREVAWILALADLPVTAHPFGLLARAAREVAALAGRALWADDNVRDQLRPAVRFVRRSSRLVPLSGETNLSPTVGATARASSTANDVRH